MTERVAAEASPSGRSEVGGKSIDVVGTGLTALDRVYLNGSGIAAEQLGGSCGNVLLSLAMLHRRVAPLLNLGMDDVGRRLVDEFVKAGADTRFIRRSVGSLSPVIAQHLDEATGRHSFAFTCPETDTALPRYEPIGHEDVRQAVPALADCSVFYTDRFSAAVVRAMELARAAGAIVFFEPSDAEECGLFQRAVGCSSILKFSADRLGRLADHGGLPEGAACIVTHGGAGLEVSMGGERRQMPAVAASVVRDTCGAGDMVSVGLIDRLVAWPPPVGEVPDMATLVPGLEAGQRLAAENCAYEGARGLFRSCGADYARSVLGRRRDA